MRVFVPHTRLQVATRVALRRVEHEPVELTAGYTYPDYWRDRWHAGEGFVNVEHDVVPWPGAVESLIECPAPWCAFGYHTNDVFADRERSSYPYVGCVKFSARAIELTRGACDGLTDWLMVDHALALALRAAGLDVHQHFPSVVNANPVLVA